MKKKLLCIALLGCALGASAQPRCNADGTVTFQYSNDSAKSVLVDVQFAGRKEMARGADGIEYNIRKDANLLRGYIKNE